MKIALVTLQIFILSFFGSLWVCFGTLSSFASPRSDITPFPFTGDSPRSPNSPVQSNFHQTKISEEGKARTHQHLLIIAQEQKNKSFELESRKTIGAHFAWVVRTLGGGKRGISQQTILRDITKAITTKDGVQVEIEGVNHQHRDLIDRIELFAGFVSRDLIPETEGYLIIGLKPYPNTLIQIDMLALHFSTNKCWLRLFGQSNGKARISLYYSLHPQIIKEASYDGYALSERKILNVTKFRNKFISDFSLPGYELTYRNIQIRSGFLLELQKLAICVSAFTKLSKQLKSNSRYSNLWRISSQEAEKIPQLIAKIKDSSSFMYQKKWRVLVNIICRDLNINIGDLDIRPDFSKEIIFKHPSGYAKGIVQIKAVPAT